MVETHAKPLDPKQLVDEFKKSGEFDRLRRQLLTHFANSDDVRPLMSRVEEIVQEKLSRDERLEHKAREAAHSEVMQDLEGYPLVERAVADLAILQDDALLTSIGQYARNIARGESNEDTKLWEAKPSRTRRQEEEEYNDGSSDYTEDEEPEDDELIITDANTNATATSRTAELEHNNSVSDAAVLHGHLSPQSRARPETKSTFNTSSPAIQNNTTIMSPHTPPWPEPQEASGSSLPSRDAVRPNIDPLAGEPLSDSFAGEHLVNGVPVGSDPDATKGDNSAMQDFPPRREEQSMPRHDNNSISPQKDEERNISQGFAQLPKSGLETRHDDSTMEMEGPSPVRSSSPSHPPPPHSPPWRPT